jgi:hypothetical protein
MVERVTLKPGSLLVFLLCLLSVTSPTLHIHSSIHHRRDMFSPIESIIKQRRTKQEQRNLHTWSTTYFFANMGRNNTPLYLQRHWALKMILGCLSCYEESFPLLAVAGLKIFQLTSYAVTQQWHDIKSVPSFQWFLGWTWRQQVSNYLRNYTTLYFIRPQY